MRLEIESNGLGYTKGGHELIFINDENKDDEAHENHVLELIAHAVKELRLKKLPKRQLSQFHLREIGPYLI